MSHFERKPASWLFEADFSARSGLPLRGIYKLIIVQKFCYCYYYYYILLMCLNQLYRRTIILPQLWLFRGAIFFRLKMPVNFNQHRAAIGVFNNRNLITNKKIFYFTESNSVGINLFSAINVMVFFFFFFMFVVSVDQKNRKVRFKLILLPLLIIGFCLYHIWLHVH